MKKILFVCHGNICRSPMAEFVMKDLVQKAGLTDQFHIASAATSREEIGNPVYPPARRKLAEHGISCAGHAARQLTRQDYADYDFLVGMDSANLRDTCTAYAAATRTGKSPCSWTTPPDPAMWQTPGTPVTSRQPGWMCWRAANACWPSSLATSQSGAYNSSEQLRDTKLLRVFR